MDLGRVGMLVRLAYFAAKGCDYGDDVVELKMAIYDLGTDINKLCSLSAHTVSDFRSASRNVMQELQVAYEYLLQGFEEDAVDSFQTLSVTAEKMAAEAKELQDRFEEQRKKVRDTIEKLEEMEDRRAKDKKKTEDDRRKFSKRAEAYKQEKERLKEREDEARKKKENLEQKREEEIAKYESPGFWTSLGRKITGEKDPSLVKAQEYREASIQQFEMEKQQRDLHNQKLEAELSVLAEIDCCSAKEGDIQTAITSLRAVNGALQHLAALMLAAVDFWVRLEKQCKDIADANFRNVVEKGLEKKSEERRLKYWHSNGFKVKAVRYCAKWVGLHSVCNDYIGGIKSTQASLRGYITTNPSLEEARAQLPALIAELKKDTEDMKEANDKLNEAADKKIREIQDGGNEEETDANGTSEENPTEEVN